MQRLYTDVLVMRKLLLIAVIEIIHLRNLYPGIFHLWVSVDGCIYLNLSNQKEMLVLTVTLLKVHINCYQATTYGNPISRSGIKCKFCLAYIFNTLKMFTNRICSRRWTIHE